MTPRSSAKGPPSSWLEAAANIADLIRCQTGLVVSQVLLKRTAGHVTIFALDAGQEPSVHTVPFEVLAQVIWGEAEVTKAGPRHTGRKAKALLMPASRARTVHPPGELKTLLTMIRP